MPNTQGKKVGVTASAFDLCHPGHVLMLEEAKKKCDYLIVFLQEDPSLTDASYRGKKKNAPIQTLEERETMLRGIRFVDEIRVYKTEEDLYRGLLEVSPDIRIIGADWKGKKFTGHDLPIEVYYNSRNHSLSTTELRERIFNAEHLRYYGTLPAHRMSA